MTPSQKTEWIAAAIEDFGLPDDAEPEAILAAVADLLGVDAPRPIETSLSTKPTREMFGDAFDRACDGDRSAFETLTSEERIEVHRRDTHRAHRAHR